MPSTTPVRALARNIKYCAFWIKDRLFRFDTAWLFEVERSLKAAKDVNEPSVLHIACGEMFTAEFSAREFGWNFDFRQSGEITCLAISLEHNAQDLNFGFRPDT